MDGKDKKLIEKTERELKGARPVKPTDSYAKDGVFYTPTKEAPPASSTNVSRPDNIRRTQKPPAPKAKMKRVKNSYKVFLAVTIIVGVSVCVFALVVMFNIFSGQMIKQKDPADKLPDLTIKSTAQTEKNEKVIEFIGVIKNIYDNKADILGVDDEVTYNIVISGVTELKDKYGQSVTLAELKMGDIVEVHYVETDLLAQLIKLTGQAWEQRSITGLTANAENKTISIGNQTYHYTDQTINLSSSKLANIYDIKATDVVSVTGYNNKVWTIKLEKSHAFLEVIPNEKIVGGVIEIGTSIYMPVEDAKTISINEGAHKIVVKAPNIETYIQDIKVDMNQTAILDLTKVQIKKGVLVIRVNTTEYTLLVNDSEITELSEPLILEYGKYKIDIKKEDYFPYSKEINVNKETITLNVSLEEKAKVGKITIDTTPAGANIFVDNVLVGISPIETQIGFGEHRIIARKEGYKDFSYTVEVSENPKEYLITLTPVPSDPVITNPDTNTDTETPTTDADNAATNTDTTPNETVPAFDDSANPATDTETETPTNTPTDTPADTSVDTPATEPESTN